MDPGSVWLRYAAVPGIGRRRLLALMQYFPSATAAWLATSAQLAAVPGLDAVLAAGLVAARGADPPPELSPARRAGAELVVYGDPAYPPLLAAITDPPPYFWRLGPLALTGPTVAVVGSRKATPYGLAVARRLAEELSTAGVTVVSGLARGIDAAAHAGALAAGGATIAVLGTGIDVPYPREHAGLYRQILAAGAIVSELPPGTGPQAHQFPERNRIISGLSLAVVVVEAGEQSGALITADTALEQGREVLAVPGPITSAVSRGPLRLIQQGAALVTSAADILAAIGRSPAAQPARPAPPELTPEEGQILAWLGDGPRTPDELADGTGLGAAVVVASLTLLEVKGLVRLLAGGQAVRT